MRPEESCAIAFRLTIDGQLMTLFQFDAAVALKNSAVTEDEVYVGTQDVECLDVDALAFHVVPAVAESHPLAIFRHATQRGGICRLCFRFHGLCTLVPRAIQISHVVRTCCLLQSRHEQRQ